MEWSFEIGSMIGLLSLGIANHTYSTFEKLIPLKRRCFRLGSKFVVGVESIPSGEFASPYLRFFKRAS